MNWTNEQRTLAELMPWERNPRQIDAEQSKRLAESVDEFGQVETLAIGPNNELYNGHQRLKTLLAQHGPDYVVDVRVASRALNEKEREKLTVYLHHSAAGSWDFTELATWDHADLAAWGFDVDLLPVDEKAGAEGSGAGSDEDNPDELAQKWGATSGQIWQIGPHYLICGDCREPATWQRLFRAAKLGGAQGVVTSPPYAEQRKKQYGGTHADQYVDWWEALQDLVKGHLADDGSFFVNLKEHSEDGRRSLYVKDLTIAMVRRWGWAFIDEFCWERNGIPGDPNSAGKFKNQWEPIFWFAHKPRPKFRPENVMHESDDVILDQNYKPGLETSQGKGGEALLGKRNVGKGLAYPGNRLKFGNAVATGHEAAYPVALPEFFIKAFSDEGDAWIDPFLGSGTTILAAHNTRRIGLGIEQQPRYLGIILQRLSVETGLQPVLVGENS